MDSFRTSNWSLVGKREPPRREAAHLMETVELEPTYWSLSLDPPKPLGTVSLCLELRLLTGVAILKGKILKGSREDIFTHTHTRFNQLLLKLSLVTQELPHGHHDPVSSFIRYQTHTLLFMPQDHVWYP